MLARIVSLVPFRRPLGLACMAFWLLGLAAATQASAAMPRAALLIGNGDYRVAPLQKLDNPQNDVRAVNSELRELGFQVTLLQDGALADMRGLVQRMAEVFPQGGIGVFYYAGHAVQYQGVNYLLPIDFRLTTPGALPRNSLALNDVLQAMQRAGVEVGIVILDACRQNPFGDASGAFGQGLALVDAPGETLIAYATRPGGLAEDGIGANSPYTGALVSALEIPGQSVHEVFAAVRAKVSQATEGRQIPWVLGSLGPLGTSFKFREAGTQVATPLEVPKGPITLASVQWNTIQKSVDPTDFERFLTLHSETPYAQVAMRRLQELHREGQAPLPQMEILAADGRAGATADRGGAVTECDVMAGDPFDPGRVTDGVPWGLVNTRIAIRACVRSLAEQNDNPRLMFTLGRALDVAERFDEAEKFYREAAARDYSAAYKNIGYMFRTARGRPRDEAEAASYYHEAALRGNPSGETSLGKLYELGLGVPQSYDEALKWYRLAAKRSWPGAIDALGNVYLLGLGVQPDPVEAVQQYRKAAMLGSSNAMFNLGKAYLNGAGVKQDYHEAVNWLVRAMEEGNPYAPYYLGKMFRIKWGVDRDYRLAISYLKLSADRGFAESYAQLAQMYANGEGVERDLTQAYYFYWIAWKAGRAHGVDNSMQMAANAEQRLAELRSKIGRQAATRAEARADAWLETNGLLQFRLVNTW